MAIEITFSYEDFKRAFLAHELEAFFEYGEYQIRLIDAPSINNEAACAFVIKPNPSYGLIRGLWERATNRDFVSEEVFPTRSILLERFRFEGRTIEELWPQLFPLFEL